MGNRLIIRDGIVVTMNDQDDVHFNGTVVIDGNRIVDVGPTDEVAQRQRDDGATIIDARGKAVM
ncbi:MAG: 5-methylthioadenosine/S-adenosylhomocysteine deaminase, partial [Chloroflexota bacterium]|nr:5-methylthioadenosine/S-adenosylhomocysteine deaminase [Chloroflexota bacterium]